MRRWWRRARSSVRLRVTALTAGLFAVVLFVGALALMHQLERSLVDDQRAQDRGMLRDEAAVLAARGLPADTKAVRVGNSVMLSVGTSSGAGVTLVGVTDPAVVGSILANHPGLTTTDSAQYVVSANDFDANAHAVLSRSTGRSGDVLVSTAAADGFVLATSTPTTHIRHALDVTRRLLWTIGPALVLAVMAAAWVIVGRALRPVQAITSQVATIGARSLHERVPETEAADEIAELTRTMNSMLDRLETSTAAARRFVSDASHELRTPLAVIRAELEIGHTDAPPTDPEPSGPGARSQPRAGTASVLRDEVDRLQTLVDDLVLLARSDEGRADLAGRTGMAAGQDRRVDILDVLHHVAARRRRVPVAVEVGNGAGDELSMTGDAMALHRAVDHVVANAARHAATAVQVAAQREGGWILVTVDDDGPGIPAEDRAEVVQRFVRLDDARARDAGGAGLGLAVASDVAAAHHGRLTISDAPEPWCGARVTFTLPAAEPGEPAD